jgi:8-oxo-dGTP diphosphatase
MFPMPASEQGVSRDRYMVIPRTAIFLRRGNHFLLLKGAPSKRLRANKYNGLGGHIERGELMEETGLTAALWLCGTLLVDTGQEIGICLYIFTGESDSGEPRESSEGLAEWIPTNRVLDLPVVEDLPILLDRIRKMKRSDIPFSARSYYDEAQRLIIRFGT